MAVKRIFVEKRQGFFDIPAQRLCNDLVETFRLTDLRAVRMIMRYDIEGLSDEEFARVRNIVLLIRLLIPCMRTICRTFPMHAYLRSSLCRDSSIRRRLRRRNAYSS